MHQPIVEATHRSINNAPEKPVKEPNAAVCDTTSALADFI